jgi:hypothetical protein
MTSALRTAVLVFAVVLASTRGADATSPPKSGTSPKQPRATGHFSDFQYIPAAGDIVGTEVFLLVGDNEHWALLQRAEGWPAAPVLVKATVSGTAVQFPFPDFGEDAVFAGHVTPFGLEGTIRTPKGAQPLRLPRHQSFWQKP